MIIIGADFRAEFQQIALVDTDTGDFQEKRLDPPDEAEKFYRSLAGQKVKLGMEASGHAPWFERLVAKFSTKYCGDEAPTLQNIVWKRTYWRKIQLPRHGKIRHRR